MRRIHAQRDKTHFCLERKDIHDRGTNCPRCDAKGFSQCMEDGEHLSRNTVHLDRVDAMGINR